MNKNPIKLIDLNPAFVGHGGDNTTYRETSAGNPVPRREGVALSFDCPCGGVCGQRPMLFLDPPLDGGALLAGTTTWKRTGDTFETMTLTPSIFRRRAACNWHGHLTKGEFKHV